MSQHFSYSPVTEASSENATEMLPILSWDRLRYVSPHVVVFQTTGEIIGKCCQEKNGGRNCHDCNGQIALCIKYLHPKLITRLQSAHNGLATKIDWRRAARLNGEVQFCKALRAHLEVFENESCARKFSSNFLPILGDEVMVPERAASVVESDLIPWSDEIPQGYENAKQTRAMPPLVTQCGIATVSDIIRWLSSTTKQRGKNDIGLLERIIFKNFSILTLIAESIVSALWFLHNKLGVAHCDVSPENILIVPCDNRTARVALIDFSAVRPLRQRTVTSESQGLPQKILQKWFDLGQNRSDGGYHPIYSDPRLLDEDEEAPDVLVDSFGLGKTLLTCLFGGPPMTDDSDSDFDENNQQDHNFFDNMYQLLQSPDVWQRHPSLKCWGLLIAGLLREETCSRTKIDDLFSLWNKHSELQSDESIFPGPLDKQVKDEASSGLYEMAVSANMFCHK